MIAIDDKRTIMLRISKALCRITEAQSELKAAMRDTLPKKVFDNIFKICSSINEAQEGCDMTIDAVKNLGVKDGKEV